MELHLGLALSSSSSSASSYSTRFDLNYENEAIHYSKKRKHGDDNDDALVLETLPLLVWNNFCNKNMSHEEHEHDQDRDGDGDDEVESNLVFVRSRNDGDVIGWPPVKLCRRKSLCHPKIDNGNDGGGQGDNTGSKSMYIKVHMEGIGIARKVDLNIHNSYQTLVDTLAKMFGKCYEDVTLTYQDKEGDWLLAGDVPWESFIKTIQRLKLLRK